MPNLPKRWNKFVYPECRDCGCKPMVCMEHNRRIRAASKSRPMPTSVKLADGHTFMVPPGTYFDRPTVQATIAAQGGVVTLGTDKPQPLTSSGEYIIPTGVPLTPQVADRAISAQVALDKGLSKMAEPPDWPEGSPAAGVRSDGPLLSLASQFDLDITVGETKYYIDGLPYAILVALLHMPLSAHMELAKAPIGQVGGWVDTQKDIRVEWRRMT